MVMAVLWGMLTPTVGRGINQLIFALFIPCLLFSNVASSVSLDLLKPFMIVGSFAIINVIFGFLMGYTAWPIYQLLLYLYSKCFKKKKRTFQIINDDNQENEEDSEAKERGMTRYIHHSYR